MSEKPKPMYIKAPNILASSYMQTKLRDEGLVELLGNRTTGKSTFAIAFPPSREECCFDSRGTPLGVCYKCGFDEKYQNDLPLVVNAGDEEHEYVDYLDAAKYFGMINYMKHNNPTTLTH